MTGHAGCINSSNGSTWGSNPEPELCWYNAVVLLKSTNGGNDFVHARPPPHHLVAAVPYRYSTGSDADEHGPNVGMGYGDLSNVFHRTQMYVTQMLSSSWNIITSLWNASQYVQNPT